jgi:pimeloyl-ACP methyl ester carboxylesterase
LEKLLLLHGALDTKEQFSALRSLLQEEFETHAFNFSGHGGKPIPDKAFSIKFFAEEVLSWLDKNNLPSVNIAGHSMGGYAGLYIARFFPERISKVLTVNTKLFWNRETASKEVKMLDPAGILEKVPRFAEHLEKLHAPADWKILLLKVSEMLTAMGEGDRLNDEDFEKITHEVLLCVGDSDKMVSVEETLHVYKKLRGGSMLVMPGAPHPFENINTQRLAFEIRNFMKD